MSSVKKRKLERGQRCLIFNEDTIAMALVTEITIPKKQKDRAEGKWSAVGDILLKHHGKPSTRG